MIGPDAFPPFLPRFPWWGPHLQTVRNAIVPPRVQLTQPERLRIPAGDGSDDVLLAALDRPPKGKQGVLAVLIHGLTGSEDADHMRTLAHALLAEGHAVVRLNLRGAGPSRATCRQRYHAGRTDDLRTVLARLPSDLTNRGAVPVGFSLGANLVLKFVGEKDFPVPIPGAVAISAPLDLAATARRIMAPDNRFYHRWLLRRMKAEIIGDLRTSSRFAEAGLRARTVWEFDDRCVAPWNGFSGAEEYYALNSSAGFLSRIETPTLIIHALNDPWIPADLYRGVAWRDHPSLIPLLPDAGGHVGFHGLGGVWSDACVVRFLGGIDHRVGSPAAGAI